ncbi:uncharacterized protein [Cicer arietinum]|uniref:uncharacterized protein n=1 Tax=Cicer arietinum TaxID=3827 RepID=UPI00032A5DD0
MSSHDIITRDRGTKRNLSLQLPNILTTASQHLHRIDIEDSDDDVIESSPRSIAQAISNAKRIRKRDRVESNLENQSMPTYFMHDMIRRTIEPIGDVYINLEANTSVEIENTKKSPETNKEHEDPKETSFNCPICMAPFVEEMSTRCGHIFCKKCIRRAVSLKGTCPTCRKKVTPSGLIRVYLPSSE